MPRESVYYLTPHQAMRIPTPPTMKNHGNYVASVSQLGRWLAEEAEAVGATILPETRRRSCSSSTDAYAACAQVTGAADARRGARRTSSRARTLSRASPSLRGDAGHLTGAAIEEFGLAGESPQVWALGVKEVWKVPRRSTASSTRWAGRSATVRSYREFGGSFIYPMGDDMVSIGMVVGLDYKDNELSVHDVLQELKTHPVVRRILEGGERVEWGAKTIPEGGFVALPREMHASGLLLCGDGAGFVNVPALKGIHYAIESGRLAAEAAFAAVRRGSSPATALGGV